MSNSVAISKQQKNGSISVHIRPELAQEIQAIAAQRQLPVEAMINEILQHFVAEQVASAQSSGAAFLLTVAGMFNSNMDDTSENVQTVVTDFILQRYGQQPL